MPPTYSIYGMEARSKRFCNRCNAAGLKQNICFCILTFKLDRSGDKQSCLGSNDISDNSMADTTLVYSANRNVDTATIDLTSPTEPITKSPARKTLSRKNDVRKVSDVENYRKTLEIEGISSNAPKLISMLRIRSSIAGYESVWTKRFRWCFQ